MGTEMSSFDELLQAEPPRPEKPPQHHRWCRLWWVVAVALALGLVAGTWFIATTFQSPAQRQAAADPPPAAPVTVAIARGDLVERTTMKASATRDGAKAVGIPLGEGESVVTAAGVSTGGSLNSGSIIAWVNDHPIFAMQGPFPLFRDIQEGDSGKDVLMVQQALADLGYDIAPDGKFGSYTASCLKDLYEEVGAEAPTQTEEAEPAQNKPEPSGATSKPAAEAPQAKPQTKKTVVIRRSDFLFLPVLPRSVVSIPAVGTVLTADTAKMSLTGESMSLSTKIPETSAGRLAAGLSGTATLSDKEIPISIASVEPVVGTDDDQAAPTGEVQVNFAVKEGTIPEDWLGHEDIVVALDLTEPMVGVLVAPARAFALDGGGNANVLTQEPDGSFTQVSVTQGSCVGGMCAISGESGIDEGTLLRVDR